ncbi:putative Early nodulin 55-2 precursor [Tripterygium wilfordii]|uniref:Putative Early nodulin 55-2 n=1 Tax=Tripterygium wilfordii TaxID=458696 RepID=A0A7J7C8X1_TRIWF|nr:early nodulin-like protein 3 [Tripterygium wilfordii]KAF5730572.1 putative Early nodulin 55-2 precursor [Tripterygium wilfordii]
MARTTITRSLGSQTKSLHALLGLLSLMLLMRTSSAREFIVGGSSWTPPGNNSGVNYNQWAEHNRFQIGDSIVFNYPPGQDSVLQVTREDYSNCTSTSPLRKDSTGKTVITFSQSGPHYFISGNKENCLKNQKLVVVVLADRSNRSSSTNQTISTAVSPAPSTTNETTTASPPSPVITGVAPAPVTTSDNYPTPAPVSTKPKNTASSVQFGFIGCFGALAASSLIFSIGI